MSAPKPKTALPWELYDVSNPDAVYAAPREDAAYIVHAANAYPRLVEALRTIADPSIVGWDDKTIARQLLQDLGETE